MSTDTIVSLIGSVGFPIVVSLILLYIIMKKDKEHKEEISELSKTMVENNVKLTEAINANEKAIMNNTEVMKQFLDIYQRKEGG